MWAATSTFQFGSLLVGVRADSDDTRRLVEGLLAKYLVKDFDAPANYSVRLPGAVVDRAGAQDLNFAYRGFSVIARSRSPVRALRSLLSYLATYVDDDDGSLLHTRELPLVWDDKAILLPWNFRSGIELLQRRFERLGLRLVDEPFARIDAVSGELVVADPALEVDDTLWDAVPDAPPGKELPPAAPGRYRITHWLLSTPAEEVDLLTPARAASRLVSEVVNFDRVGAARLLSGLQTAVHGSTVVPLSINSQKEFLEMLGALKRAS